MNRPYWSGSNGRGGNTYADDVDDTGATDALEIDESEDYDAYGYAGPDNRWRWIAGFAAVVLFASVVAIASVLNKDTATSSSTSTSETSAVTQDAMPPTSTTPRTVIATVPPSQAPGAGLAPETVVTVTTTPSADHTVPEPPPPPVEAPAPERTITYTVTGTRQLFDLVTIIYTDEQGFPRTDINVALPWTKTIVLNPGVDTRSVTGTSVSGQLNCSVTDGTGATLAAQNNNTMIAACVP